MEQGVIGDDILTSGANVSVLVFGPKEYILNTVFTVIY